MQASNGAFTNAKRKLEGDINQMQADLDNLITNAKNSEEKAKKAMIDAGRLADELRTEQDHSMNQVLNLLTVHMIWQPWKPLFWCKGTRCPCHGEEL